MVQTQQFLNTDVQQVFKDMIMKTWPTAQCVRTAGHRLGAVLTQSTSAAQLQPYLHSVRLID